MHGGFLDNKGSPLIGKHSNHGIFLFYSNGEEVELDHIWEGVVRESI